MIYDTLENLGKYKGLHANLDRVIDSVLACDLSALPNGRTVIDGDSAFINVMDCDYHPADGALFEAHREYADLQVSLTGDEQIGYLPLDRLPEGDPDKETVLFEGCKADFLIPMKKGMFVILFPQDGHAPCIGEGKGHKICAKIRM